MDVTDTKSKLKFGGRAICALNLMLNRRLHRFACFVLLLFCAIGGRSRRFCAPSAHDEKRGNRRGTLRRANIVPEVST
jgi:hypothetical protein